MNNISPVSQKYNQLSASNENIIKEQKSQNDNFLKSKVISAEFFDFHILPRVESHFKIVMKGATIVQSTDDSFI